ncbi:hypothetical protein [Bacillus sp. UMB0893]|uniref:hypothetical protein n=1 Tax=Bacillus sp. UMB0893 TaxID=2066053 RepID=UPI000C789380|nr:hypothetical protein [Bacillus sp. UMB0893]PLR69873.1 hypothetical protein CYJ36_05470 [Bacillus sp. UMB0893]QNG58651.1 hypothetical protein H4O14_12480 [Bacillus sp. PAMC26568]
MAFGIKRKELVAWKTKVAAGELAFLTHYWIDPRFSKSHAVTKAGCSDIKKLIAWGEIYGLKKEWIHQDKHYPHFDLMGDVQIKVLTAHNLTDQIERFRLQ